MEVIETDNVTRSAALPPQFEFKPELTSRYRSMNDDEHFLGAVIAV